MGVRNLEYFIKTYVLNGFVSVSLIDEIERFQRINNVRPVLVIDLMGLVQNISSNNFDSLCGGRHAIYAKTLHKLFSRLNNVGAELVFFSDGPVRGDNYQNWIRRLNVRYQKSIKIIEDVDNGMRFSHIVDENAAQICRVTSIYELLEDIARQYGSLTMATDAECDTEIAEYASTNPAVLAVLAEDSDFLIFPGNFRYFSLRYLDRNSLITNEYNRKALRHKLELNDKELACLSTIGGNNFIENTTNCNQIYQKFTKIANCIKLSNLKTLNEENLSEKINMMINTIPTKTTLMQIEKSLEFYHTDFIKTDLRSERPFIYKCLQHNMRFVYNVLSEFPVNFTLSYYDLRKEPISYYNLVIPLFKRKIGILYNHRCQLRRNYYVYSKLSHLRSYERLKVDPIFPNQNVPPLSELLFGEDNDALNQVRFNLLKEIIGISSLLDVDLKTISKNYLVDVLVLVFLVLNNIISILEADIILISIIKVELGEFEEIIDYPSTLDPRAFRIALLFAKIYSNINGALEVVGLIKLKKIINFDGPLFHNLYATFKEPQNQPDLRDLLKDLNHCRIYK